MSVLPILSEAVARCDLVVEVVDIWQHIIERQTEGEKATAKRAPKTVVSVVREKMKELVGSVNPLCQEDYDDLATEIILDLVSKHSFDPKSPDLVSRNGLTLTSMSGKKLVFVKDSTVKALNKRRKCSVAQVLTLNDGTVAIGINDFLFDHEEKIREALKEMKKKPGLRSRIKAFFKRDDEEEGGNDDKKEGKDDKKEGKDDKKEGKEDKIEGKEDKIEGKDDKKEGKEDKIEGKEDKIERKDDKKKGKDDKKEGKEDKKERKDDKKKGNGE